ncbi:DUF6262 family protein [Streptomyces sp. P17]|uniref:DUF6262 family protein n=1 Tax=Streptomyces sp. P17 TaxID=3074716 RepID=UPI0028F40C02|nr:DUF6262 family protein [Streptomyces sp. P17]MDT9696702.1 DUF6262 family protein [Streptomyces sp. P17]
MKPTAPAGGNDRDARIERLHASRTRDSEAKTARALEAVSDLLSSGRRISVAQVAREASVSTWFIYNQPKVHDAVRTGMTTQRVQGLRGRSAPGTQLASPAALQTELALAREEIKDLKRERDRLRERVRLSLGAEIEEVDHNRLVERIQQLERENADLRSQLSAAQDQLNALKGRLQEVEDELVAARAGLRRAMRSVPPR